ncbi:hypothetical protein PR202_gb29545 [Eleusine coracana subsp. coracana]|uniref:STAS domain-containing protein n=1 Tax=Eleusine coracana subsp. coracana TaxID=191504 RepID=A0AAV5G0A6_ELECO|nr:hypothetical protein PR202_gb29545 [Eleusine coracana subsp. coracana]
MRGTGVLACTTRGPGALACATRNPGVLVCATRGPVATPCATGAPGLREYELNLPNSNRGPDVGRVYFVILEMSPVTYIDSSAVQALKDLYQEYKARQIQIAIANPNRQVHLLLSRSGIIDLIGAGWCFVRVHDAVQVCLQHVQSSSPNSMKLAPQVSEDSTDSNSTPKAEQQHRQYGFVKNLWEAHDGDGEAGGEVQPLLRQNLV